MAHQGNPQHYYPIPRNSYYPHADAHDFNTTSKSVTNGFEAYKGTAHQNSRYLGTAYSNAPSNLQNHQTASNPAVMQTTVHSRTHPGGLKPSLSSKNTGNASVNALRPPKPQAPEPSVNHATLLLALAEQYFGLAYGPESKEANAASISEGDNYFKLISAGLGCLETVLAKCTVAPEQEALVRLRYASILYEETEDVMEAEEALSKSISVADRHKLYDLKYNMQHLMVRVLFERRSPAALTFLDSITKNVEIYQHVAWVYAFRFLGVSLHLELASESKKSLNAALSMLKHIISLSEKLGDVSILAIASIMRAWVCLKTSNSAENFEEAQTSLATARSLQTNPLMSKFHQLNILAAFVDLCCYLQHFDPVQAVEKTQIMQNALTLTSECKEWMVDGSFFIPLRKERMPSCRRQEGIVSITDEGSLRLHFNWMPKDDIYTVAYLLSGIAFAHKNGAEGQKAENMLQDGIKRESHNQRQSDAQPKSIASGARLQLWRQQLSAYMRLHLAFILCARSSWHLAEQHINLLHKVMDSWSSRPLVLDRMLQLLLATHYQGTGHLDEAVGLLEDLVTTRHESSGVLSHVSLDASRVSTLNLLSILHEPSHMDHQRASELLAQLSSDCSKHSNRQIQSAYHLLQSILPETSTMIKEKQFLQRALETAKACANYPLLTRILGLMFEKFFQGQVSEQAKKSARASHIMAKKVGDNLWICVTAGHVWRNSDSIGSIEEAELMESEAWEAARLLPSATQQGLNLVDAHTENEVDMREAG
ncbi:uncharacterized protein KY384_003772 [Bacidia gigantensis]|uniref:uncharacterized protein n=1 Tax=Bacidia gigantensis TaxID=2732470 RepID=UPI001D044263|nr:uncharacterized protein KY384_003772 [Bacidia gigantensis]KAG8532133.1 hypothetical protein KY384_003772 [Bacidia gigantensis]